MGKQTASETLASHERHFKFYGGFRIEIWNYERAKF
jgi:hypothetical protein